MCWLKVQSNDLFISLEGKRVKVEKLQNCHAIVEEYGNAVMWRISLGWKWWTKGVFIPWGLGLTFKTFSSCTGRLLMSEDRDNIFLSAVRSLEQVSFGRLTLYWEFVQYLYQSVLCDVSVVLSNCSIPLVSLISLLYQYLYWSVCPHSSPLEHQTVVLYLKVYNLPFTRGHIIAEIYY